MNKTIYRVLKNRPLDASARMEKDEKERKKKRKNEKERKMTRKRERIRKEKE